MSSGEQEALRLAKGLRDGTLLLSERDEAAEWLERLHAEREADRALMREALDVIVFLYGRTARYDTDVVSAISKLRARVG
jgi:hypothetical protein